MSGRLLLYTRLVGCHKVCLYDESWLLLIYVARLWCGELTKEGKVDFSIKIFEILLEGIQSVSYCEPCHTKLQKQYMYARASTGMRADRARPSTNPAMYNFAHYKQTKTAIRE